MKLMSDLIAYLRDLLVGKVKPDALAEDLNPDLQKSLQEQAAIIETDRLLELIDQFAAAEGRMKWAPNKRLHFEVAVIKAIQTLNQVTLNEVIENLTALRDGKSDPPKAGSRPEIAKPAPPAKAMKSAAPEPAGQTEAGQAAQPKPAAVTTTKLETADPKDIWQNVIARVRISRPLASSWAETAHPLGIEGRFFLLGFPPEKKMAMESLASPKNRDFLEAIIQELSGQELKMKMELKEGLPAPAKAKADPAAPFKDDPLIQEALEIFKGEIKT